MANVNAFKKMAVQTALYKKKYKAFFGDFCQRNYDALIGSIQERTPVDFGVLREGFAQNSSIATTGEKVVFTVYNPSDYAAHVEYGYHQKPGMILKMKMDKGRLRFVEFMGWSRKYGVGDPTGKAEPDENGFYTIVTRKRLIPGRHMVADSVSELQKELPKRWHSAFSAFSEANGPWRAQ